jgi:peptidoglycan-associated lipoprotein
MSPITRLSIVFVSSALIVFVGLGCASTSSDSTPQAASSSEPSEAPSASVPPKDFQTSATVPKTHLDPVYFDTDIAVLRPDAREKLTQYAKSILDHPEWGVLKIEGHCDERGSDAYNMALGMRRAAAVERHLLDVGVPQSRLATQTFGSRAPAASGHDESAWRHNRRSELRTEDVLASARRRSD